jgi:transposase-like protein
MIRRDAVRNADGPEWFDYLWDWESLSIRLWDCVIPFLAFAPTVRCVIWTKNAIEGIDAQLREAVEIWSHFEIDEAESKFI